MNIRNAVLQVICTAALVLASASGRADDTDIYYAPGSGSTGGEPLVMFSLDWRPNLGSTVNCGDGSCQFLIDAGALSPTGPYTFFDILRAALKVVMEPLTGIRIGLMINHDNRNNCASKVVSGCSNGGYMALGAKLFTKDDSNGAKAAFHAFLAAMPTPQGNQSHAYQGKELFFELYRYLTGQGVYNGHVGYTDFASNSTKNLDVESPALMWDTSIESGANYISPLLTAGSCSKIFTVNFLFQVSQQEDDSDTAIGKATGAGGMGLSSSTFPDVIGWLNDADLASGQYGTAPTLDGKQNVTSYFIVDPTKINTKTTGYAQAGGTGVPLPLSEDPQTLVDTLSNIFDQILSVSATFVSASVPVNVFNRSEVVDNVFIALFQPDEDTTPFWDGNVKKLRVAGLNTASPVLVDAEGQPAISADGRIRFDALTYWTDPATLPPADVSKNEVDGKDGRVVYRGGAGQKIPGFLSGSPGTVNGTGTRQLYYDDGGALAPLNADGTTATNLRVALGAATDSGALRLLSWARGLDVDDLDDDDNFTEAREWIFGDPLHSRPLPLNFGTRGGYSETNPAIYLAVGSNDGFLRLIRNTTTGGAQSGAEVWAFMPQAVMGKLATLRTNTAGVKHPYLVDDSPVALLDDANNNGTLDTDEKAWLYFGLRRGGKALYALDISDPEVPSLLWSIEKGGDFAELANTFSTPRVIRVPDGTGSKPALIFGGGYDTNKDLRSGVGSDDTEGQAVYVVDAETGDLIWKAVGGSGTASDTVFYHAEFRDSVPSAVAVLDSDGNGEHDRAYFGDMGGNVWRVDMSGGDTSDWKLTRLARLGRHATGASGKASDRRFFHRPDIVQSFDEDGAYDAVVIGSGDREDPKDYGGTTENYMFMLKDRSVAAGAGVDVNLEKSALADVTNTCLTSDGACAVDLDEGWALRLQESGEKSLATPVTISNTVYFTSYLPNGGVSAGSCGPSEGTGRLYAVSLKNAAARNNYDSTTDEDDRYTDLASPGIPSEIVSLPPSMILRPDLQIDDTGAPNRFRTYWFEEEDSAL